MLRCRVFLSQENKNIVLYLLLVLNTYCDHATLCTCYKLLNFYISLVVPPNKRQSRKIFRVSCCTHNWIIWRILQTQTEGKSGEKDGSLGRAHNIDVPPFTTSSIPTEEEGRDMLLVAPQQSTFNRAYTCNHNCEGTAHVAKLCITTVLSGVPIINKCIMGSKGLAKDRPFNHLGFAQNLNRWKFFHAHTTTAFNTKGLKCALNDKDPLIQEANTHGEISSRAVLVALRQLWQY